MDLKSFLCKVDYSDGHVWFKDGVIIAHKNQIYMDFGLNPLIFEWKTSDTSFYTEVKQSPHPVQVNLKFNEEGEFETLEGEVLHVSIKQNFSSQLCALSLGQIYKLRVSFDLEAIHDKVVSLDDEMQQDLFITQLKDIKKCQRAKADHLSKVLHIFLTQSGGQCISV